MQVRLVNGCLLSLVLAFGCVQASAQVTTSSALTKALQAANDAVSKSVISARITLAGKREQLAASTQKETPRSRRAASVDNEFRQVYKWHHAGDKFCFELIEGKQGWQRATWNGQKGWIRGASRGPNKATFESPNISEIQEPAAARVAFDPLESAYYVRVATPGGGSVPMSLYRFVTETKPKIREGKDDVVLEWDETSNATHRQFRALLDARRQYLVKQLTTWSTSSLDPGAVEKTVLDVTRAEHKGNLWLPLEFRRTYERSGAKGSELKAITTMILADVSTDVNPRVFSDEANPGEYLSTNEGGFFIARDGKRLTREQLEAEKHGSENRRNMALALGTAIGATLCIVGLTGFLRKRTGSKAAV